MSNEDERSIKRLDLDLSDMEKVFVTFNNGDREHWRMRLDALLPEKSITPSDFRVCEVTERGSLAEPKIEVTPEMIEAGLKVLKASGIADDYLEADKLLVSEIYRAMFAAKQKGETEAPPSDVPKP